MKIKRLLTITKKEIIHIKRDRASLGIAIVLPILMLILFGFAVNTDVNNVDLVVCDESKTVESRELIDSFVNSYYFRLYGMVGSSKQAEKYIDDSRCKVALIIPPDYSKELRKSSGTEVQILVDGSDPTIARTAVSYSLLIGNNYSNKINMKQVNISKNKGINFKPLVLYNPTLESSRFNVPGVIGLILQNITVILTAFAMVREKERGTIEQLIMTPVTSFELIAGKLIPYIVIGFVDMIISLVLGRLMFGVDIKGSVLLLLLLGTLFLVCSLAIGMLISTVAKTQLQAMQASIALILPSVLLSGFMFPREAMPKVIYFISSLLPLTYFLEILRGIMLKGIGASYLAVPIISLSVLTILILSVTMIKFSKTLD